MKRIIPFLIMPMLLILGGCVTSDKSNLQPLATVTHVDLKRYVGQWYEIARYQHRFQEGCVGSRALYTLRDDGRIDVLNECYVKSSSGKLRSVKGMAKVVDRESNARLKVSFFWPFYGDYWIIDLGDDYEYAVVGHPNRKYLWVLSRTPDMEEGLYKEILARLEKQGYDTSKLILSAQLKK